MPTTTRLTLLHDMRNLDDKQSWSKFLRIYRPVIANTIRRFHVDPTEAEDILQEVLLQMSKTIQGYEKDSNKGRFRSYLRRITVNKVKDYWRKHDQKVSCLEHPGAVPQESHHEEIWEDELNRSLFRMALQSVQKRSKELTWNCFQEHVLNKTNAVAVAARLGVSENAVYVNSSRIMARVRDVALRLKREHCANSI